MARLVSPLGIVVETDDENARRMLAAGYVEVSKPDGKAAAAPAKPKKAASKSKK